MKRIEAIKKLTTGADEVLICLEDGTEYYGRELVELYAYLDADLCDPKKDPQKPKEKLDERKANKPIPEKAVAGSKKREKIDMGKLIALAKAGRTKEWIAEEMGISVATVYNYLKKAREEGRL